MKLKEPTTLEAINLLLQSHLPGRFRAEVRNDRLRLVENAAKSCTVSLRIRSDETKCSVVGFMPSVALRAVVLIGIVVTLSLISSLVLGRFNVLTGGAIPFAIAYFSMHFPSQVLVKDVSAIIQSELGESTQPKLRSFRWWAGAGGVISAAIFLVALGTNWWSTSKPTEVSIPERKAVETRTESRGVFPEPVKNDPLNSYSAFAEISGRISHLHPNLKPGETVSRQTVVVRFDAEDLVRSLQSTGAELKHRKSELDSLEAQETTVRNMYESAQQQLTAGVEDRLLPVVRQEVDVLQRELDGIESRQRLFSSEIAAIEQEVSRLRTDLERTEVSLPVDVRIKSVLVEHDQYVSASSILFEATVLKPEPENDY